VRGAGRAYSGEVADRGAASLWWNPASIAGLDKNEIYGGVHLVQVDSQVNDRGSTLTRPVIPGGLTTSVGGDRIAGGPINNGIVPTSPAPSASTTSWPSACPSPRPTTSPPTTTATAGPATTP
jgi:long-chain fatty acid transport protein